MTIEPTRVDFHFDIMCPYAYRTSIWMREVRDRLGIEVGWRFFSLEEVNRRDGGKHPWEREWSYGWSMMRVGVRLQREVPELLDRWYEVAGRALHVEARKPHAPEVARELVAGMGLDPALVDEAIADPTTHEPIHADHQRVIAGGGFGVPTLAFDEVPGPTGPSFLFGPVVVDPPTGEAAERLWRLVVGWLEFPHLYELQRPKSPADLEYIVEEFTPYLRGRDWESVQNPTP